MIAFNAGHGRLLPKRGANIFINGLVLVITASPLLVVIHYSILQFPLPRPFLTAAIRCAAGARDYWLKIAGKLNRDSQIFLNTQQTHKEFVVL